MYVFVYAFFNLIAFLQLSFSPTTPGWSHIRLIGLLSSIFSISVVMIIVSIVFGLFSGINMFAFMGAEVSTFDDHIMDLFTKNVS